MGNRNLVLLTILRSDWRSIKFSSKSEFSTNAKQFAPLSTWQHI